MLSELQPPLHSIVPPGIGFNGNLLTQERYRNPGGIIFRFGARCQLNHILKFYSDDSTIHHAFQRQVGINLFERQCEEYSRQLRSRKIFPVDRVRIARKRRSIQRSDVSKTAGKPDFIGFSRFVSRRESVAPSLQ